ncbi:MAG: TatD family hydrolase [Alcanivoracaceae bacterium]|nr:TatD family hydrolase [Alcanivoracaceae bacterium]
MTAALNGLVDSHCHLDRIDLKDYPQGLPQLLEATAAAGVSHLLCIGVDLESFPAVRELAERYSHVHCTVGVHPLYRQSRPAQQAELVELAQHPRVVAIGETGLDYFYAKDDTRWQRESFAEHIAAARETGLPLVIHTRDAREDTIAMLRDLGDGKVRGVLHCFTEDLAMAEQAMELGFYISISGIVTFANAEPLRDVVRALPLERLLIETDAPWLAPVPHRGKQNEPRYVADVARFVADLKQLPATELVAITRDNFFSLFNKAKPV